MREHRGTDIEFQELLRFIKRDSNQGLKEFHERYYCCMEKQVWKVSREDDVVQEVINRVLCKIWQRVDKFIVLEIKDPEAFVRTITANYAKSVVRRKKFVHLDENVAVEDEGIQDVIEMDSFYFLIRNLSKEEQEMMKDRFVKGESFKEFAKRNGIAVSSASSKIYRALEKIKKEIFTEKKEIFQKNEKIF